jgi:hypothetical protein
MSSELQYYGDPVVDTGLTVVARVYNSSGVQVGSDVATTEVGALAIYRGDMPVAVEGNYGVRFFSDTLLLGQETIFWDGTAERTILGNATPTNVTDSETVITNAISALNDFNPATDTVANVTLVATTTTNTDMRGTDNALLTTDIRLDYLDSPISESGVVTVGGAISKQSGSFTLTTGVVVSGTHLNTHTKDGIFHQLQDSAGTLDVYYEFDIGSNTIPTTVIAQLYSHGNNDTIALEAYNWVDLSWDHIDTIDGENQTVVHAHSGALFTNSVGTGANDGLVRIRFNGTGLTSSNLYLDQLLVGYTSIAIAPDNASITAILADTNELQINQGNWLTATGFATPTNVTDSETVITNAIAALNNLSAAQVNAEVDTALLDYDGPTKAELDAAETAILNAISGLNNLDAATTAAAIWDYLQSETTVSDSMKDAVQIVLKNAKLIPAAL